MRKIASSQALAKRQYSGRGRPHPHPLPGAFTDAEPYVAPQELRRAVEMTLYLRRPLLVEGEPGTGKTRLAHSIASELGYPLKEMYIRSTSRAQDLLWTFDAVRRLYDIQERSAAQWGAARSSGDTQGSSTANQDAAISNEKYVKLGPLGEAIDLAMRNIPSVVLIDEIDKADVDFPNDLLLVLDRLRFEVDEVPGLGYDALMGRTPEERRHYLPIVVITSNREKELPAAFLRRCLFYYIPFPDRSELKKILEAHFCADLTPLFACALDKFWLLRDRTRFQWRKMPSTSELLDWVRLLERDAHAHRLDAPTLAATPLEKLPYLEALFKTQSDRDALVAAAQSKAPVSDG